MATCDTQFMNVTFARGKRLKMQKLADRAKVTIFAQSIVSELGIDTKVVWMAAWQRVVVFRSAVERRCARALTHGDYKR